MATFAFCTSRPLCLVYVWPHARRKKPSTAPEACCGNTADLYMYMYVCMWVCVCMHTCTYVCSCSHLVHERLAIGHQKPPDTTALKSQDPLWKRGRPEGQLRKRGLPSQASPKAGGGFAAELTRTCRGIVQRETAPTLQAPLRSIVT